MNFGRRRLFFDPSSYSYGNTLFFGNGDPIFQGTRSVMSVGATMTTQTFFNSPEELFGKEYYDEQWPEKKRRLTPEQVHLLEKSFEEENKLEPERKTELAMKLGVHPRQVAVWFQNRRARWKTKQLERDFDCLKSMYESLLSDYYIISKENEKLKSEVLSLTEKLQAKEVSGAPISCQNPDLYPLDMPPFPLLPIKAKAEEHLSTGTSRSVVVDEDGLQQLMDSGDSYFPAFVATVDGFQSEEEEGYFSDVYPAVVVVEQHTEEEELLCSWVWS